VIVEVVVVAGAIALDDEPVADEEVDRERADLHLWSEVELEPLERASKSRLVDRRQIASRAGAEVLNQSSAVTLE